MRIVITVSSLTKGSGLSKYVYNLCEVLKDDGNEIHVVTTHAAQPDFERQLFRADRNITVHQLHRCSRYGKYARLAWLIRRLDADLIINNYNAPVQFVLPLCKRRAKVVHVIHNDTSDFYRVASINGKYVDGWITPTPGVKDRFDTYTHGKYTGRVTAISHGVELPSTYGVVSRRGERMEMVFVGVLYEHKGVMTLPSIVRILRDRKVDFHLTVIGKGILEEDLHRDMERDVEDGFVEFTGVISAKEVYRRMAGAHIFLYPTRLDSFGLVIAEAMMNGAVPVVTRLKGITDALVDDGVNGCLVEDPNDAVAFADCVDRLDKDRGLWDRMSREARAKAEGSFSLRSFMENYRHYFNKITER